MNLRQTLYAWRDDEAAKRGVEVFRILPNHALDEIVRSLPRTKDELTAIKGIKDAKYHHYGKTILNMVDEHAGSQSSVAGHQLPEKKTKELQNNSGNWPLATENSAFSVSTYLDIINRELYRVHARVKGEVTSVKFQGSALYVGLKDSEDESSLSVFMWARDYALSGLELSEGMEVVVEGRSEVYKPSGRLSFRAETIELVGEGALKKAYDALRKKLEAEGLFALEKKRPLGEYPERVGLITSKQGAVIHDFLSNLGKFGFTVRFMDSRVEGAAAVKDLLSAIKYFSTQPIDALVVIRGGGSLESLQAFNNERVVRAIAEFSRPVICAIGHDKDIPLAQLAADHAPSTPTAATTLLNQSWEEGMHSVRHFTTDIFNRWQEELWNKKEELGAIDRLLRDSFARISELIEKVVREFSALLLRVQKSLTAQKGALERVSQEFFAQYAHSLKEHNKELGELSRSLQFYSPLRQLKLGYSILSRGGKVIRGVKGLEQGEHFEARLSDGTLEAKIVASHQLLVTSKENSQ